MTGAHTPGNRGLFVSYARTDKIDDVVKGLRLLGKEVWLDDSLLGGQAWWDSILARIRDCDVFVQAITPAATRSEACNSERKYAAALGKPILPLFLEKVPEFLLPADLAVLQYVDYREATEQRAFRLAAALAALPEAPPLPDPLPASPPVPVSYLIGLAEKLRAPELSLDQQAAIVARLQSLIEQPEEHAEEYEGAIQLLREMQSRGDLYHAVSVDITRILDTIGTTRPPAKQPQRQGLKKPWPKLLRRAGQRWSRVRQPADAVIRWLRRHSRMSLTLGAAVLVSAIAAVMLVMFWPPGGDEWSLADVGPAVLDGQRLADIAALPSGNASVAVGWSEGRPEVWTYDGASWSRLPQDEIDLGTGKMRAVVSSGQTVVAVGNVVQSPGDIDGMVWRRSARERWTRRCSAEICGGTGLQQILGVAPVATRRFIAVGRDASSGDFDAAVWRSHDDGSTWQRVAASDPTLGGSLDQAMRDVVKIGGRIVAVGSSGGNGAVWVSKDDGKDWALVSPGTAFSGLGGSVELLAIERLNAPTGVRLIAVGRETSSDSRAAAWFSDDGEQWTKATVRNARYSGEQMIGVVATDNELVAVGNAAENEAGVWTSEDGSEWVGVSSGSFHSPSGMTGVTTLKNGTVFAVGTAIWLSHREK